jgi:small conductance mechanosensitive channel
MWEWLTINSIWILIASGFALVLLLFTMDWVRDKVVKIAPEEQQAKAQRRVTLAFWTAEGVASLLLAVSLVALVISEEGIAAIVSPLVIEQWFLEHGSRIFIILLVGIVLWLGAKRFLPALVHRSMARPTRGESRIGRKKRGDTLVGVFMGLGKIIIVVIVAFMILGELNINIAPILAGLGIVGIAVGFGAQYLIRDLIAGVFILLAVLRDLDGIVHHVPNGEIRVASNYTRRFSRVNLDVSVAYSTDLDHAISVINRVGQELAEDEQWKERIIKPPQVLRVNKFGDSGIDIKILGDVQPIEQWAVMGELRLRLKKAFDEAEIEIPWPHVKLFFGEQPADKGLTCPACSHINPPGSKFCAHCGASLSSR